LDPQNLTARVYRESLADKNGVLVKDIARLNRPLDNVITMEPYPETAKQYADNSLIVKRWNGDKKDRFFTEAIVFLECKFYEIDLTL
jgi:import inner membrane translocase subunit TIM50